MVRKTLYPRIFLSYHQNHMTIRKSFQYFLEEEESRNIDVYISILINFLDIRFSAILKNINPAVIYRKSNVCSSQPNTVNPRCRKALVIDLVHKSLCNTVCIYGHANKSSCCYCYLSKVTTECTTTSIRTALF